MDKIANPAMGDNSARSVLSSFFSGDFQESYKLLSDVAKQTVAKAEDTLTKVGIGALAIVDKVAETAKVYALFELLDDDEFFKREKAEKDLASMGQAAKPYLMELLKDPPSLEVKMRATRLYRKVETVAEKFERNTAELQRITHQYIDQQDIFVPKELGKKLADVIISGDYRKFEELVKAEGNNICSNVNTLKMLLAPLGIHLSYKDNPEALSNGDLTISSNGKNPQSMRFFVSWGLGGPTCSLQEYMVANKRKEVPEKEAYLSLIQDALKASTANMQ